MIRFIGDIHGHLDLYQRALRGCDQSVQVGDFGIGFIPAQEKADWPDDSAHLFIRGNHDNPALARAHPRHIESGPAGPLFYVGGGWSIDATARIPGRDWWPDEEHSWPELRALIDAYIDARPRVVVSHEPPASIAQRFFGDAGSAKTITPSRTSNALEAMLALHRPAVWVFGHWHERRDWPVGGTRFVSLEIGGWVDVEV